MKVVQISDCHLFADINKNGYNNINPALSLQSVLVEVKSQQPDLLLVTGDISGDGSKQSYQHFCKLISDSTINCKINVIPGNHDNQSYLKATLPADYLWVTNPHLVVSNRWRIHLLDTQFQTTLGKLSANQINALSDYVEQHNNDYHLIATHHHPVDCGGWMDKHQWLNRQTFNDVVSSQPSIKGVVYGHIHVALSQQRGHCLDMACPATCWQYSTESSFSTTDLMPGFRVINLDKNGQIDTTIHRLKERS